MRLIKCILTANDCYKAGRTITPKGVMVHSTGANNPLVARYVQPVEGQSNEAQLKAEIGGNRNANDWNNPGLDVCTHAFVGKLADGGVGTVQTLPWNHRGWHAGTGTSGGSANNTHIAFEICEDDLTDEGYFRKVYQEAVELTAMLCKTYNLNPLADGVVICHSEGHQRGIASNHSDVMHWFPKFDKSMDTFRSDVAKALGSNGGSSGGSGSTSNPGTGGTIVKGSVVRVKQGAKTYDGGSLASFVYGRDHVVSEVSGDRCVITYNGVVVAAVRKSDLTLVSGGGSSSDKPTTPAPVPTQKIVKGSVVRVKQGAKDYNGGGLASFVYTRDHIVSEVSGDRCVITYNGVVVAAVRKSDLTLVSGGGSSSNAKPTAPATAPAKEIVKGSVVRVKSGAKDYNGGGLAGFVYTRDHVVSEVSGDRCVITYGGAVVAAVRKSDLTLVSGGSTTSSSKPTTTAQIVKGSTVRVNQGAKTYDGGGLASFVYTRDHIVSEVSGDRCVITYNGVVVAAVRKSDLTLV